MSEEKPCKECGTVFMAHQFPDGRFKRLCVPCDRAYQQEYRNRRKAAAEDRAAGRDPEFANKQRVRHATQQAIRSGKLIRQPCEECGDANSEAHHEDYSKPFDVKW